MRSVSDNVCTDKDTHTYTGTFIMHTVPSTMSESEAGQPVGGKMTVQSNLTKWIPIKWITSINGYHLSGPRLHSM